MRLRQTTPDEPMCAQLADALDAMRAARAFDPGAYLDAKVRVLGDYFDVSGLDTAVVAVSGGVDSAVVAGICSAAVDDGAIANIVAVTAPVHTPGAVTHQVDTVNRARQVADTFGLDLVTVDLTATHQALSEVAVGALGIDADPWASGQLAALVRTPAMYMVNTLLTSAGRPAVLCGTINRDEGAYLGFVGKASDGMVDLQLISDLHKSEVYDLARHLGVPGSVLAVEPNGDMFDGRPDTDVFGAPYDFVELYLGWRCLRPVDQGALVDSFDADATEQWQRWSAALERLHRLNAHKYLVGSPAVHLDVLRSDVPGGWEPPRHRTVDSGAPTSTASMHGWFDPGPAAGDMFRDAASGPAVRVERLDAAPVTVARSVLSGSEVAALAELVSGPDGYWQPSTMAGTRATGDGDVASWRRTVWLPELAGLLAARLDGVVAPFVYGDDPLMAHDTDGEGVWRWVGVNPLMRFIRYDDGGFLVVHTDAPYVASDVTQSLMSLIVYVDSDGATTRFLGPDAAGEGPGRFDDWDRGARPDEVVATATPGNGDTVLFPHRVLHDGPPVTAPKLIVRTDLMFERCGPPLVRR